MCDRYVWTRADLEKARVKIGWAIRPADVDAYIRMIQSAPHWVAWRSRSLHLDAPAPPLRRVTRKTKKSHQRGVRVLFPGSLAGIGILIGILVVRVRNVETIGEAFQGRVILMDDLVEVPFHVGAVGLIGPNVARDEGRFLAQSGVSFVGGGVRRHPARVRLYTS